MATMAAEICCNCGIEFHVPSRFQHACRNDSSKWFFCPNGHRQHYSESDLDRERRERQRLEQRLSQRDDEIRRQKEMREHAERSASTYKGHVTRLKKRASAGLCPCCNRSFENLSRHMKGQHPNYVAEEVE